MEGLVVEESPIKGFYVVSLEVHGDNRGWFKEGYQQAKLEALGLPSFKIVQNNFSFNKEVGVTRGLHAEPWNKYITVAIGKVLGVWVDLRKGEGFGTVFSLELDHTKAVFVPKGVANGYQTIEPNTCYTYLVDEHWSPDSKYLAVDAFDDSLGINWPTKKETAIVSDKDLSNPKLSQVKPMEI